MRYVSATPGVLLGKPFASNRAVGNNPRHVIGDVELRANGLRFADKIAGRMLLLDEALAKGQPIMCEFLGVTDFRASSSSSGSRG
jgi:hypothetical protein